MKDASLGYVQALLANIRLGWKGLPETINAQNTDKKSFITLGPGVNVIKLFCRHI